VKAASQWSLGARILALCLPVVALLTFIAIGAAVAASRNDDQLDTLLNKVGPLRVDTRQLENAMLNQETGIRGYAIGGTPADLQPYTDGLAMQNAMVADLERKTEGRPQMRADLAAVNAAINAWQSNVARPAIAAVQRGDRTTALDLADPTSRHDFDAVRTELATLSADAGVRRDAAVHDVQRSSRQIVWALVTSVVIIAIAGVVLGLLLRRMVRNPVARLTAEVRRVAAGDYNHRVDAVGPPELASLGSDVEEMRHRIVADLRVVQAANEAVERANAQLESANAQLEGANAKFALTNNQLADANAQLADANTQLGEANQQLELQAADLQRSNQDLEQFAYVASHDLQEPLRKVASFCQLLQRRYAGQLDERADQYIAFAVDGAHRMQRLINDLLAFSRIGRITTGFTDIDLNEIVAAATAANDDGLDRTHGTVDASDLPMIKGEEPLLVALFGNLISNSVKFRRPDAPVRIRITAERQGDEWRIDFRDNGIGIEPEFADKVFVIFQRLHPRDAYPGTGIGLAVAKRIVEHHGGRIWLDTTVDDGAAIAFTVRATPIATSPSETVDARPDADEPALPPVDALNSTR
jgi:signal transduction histidine kinase